MLSKTEQVLAKVHRGNEKNMSFHLILKKSKRFDHTPLIVDSMFNIYDADCCSCMHVDKAYKNKGMFPLLGESVGHFFFFKSDIQNLQISEILLP